MISPYRLTLPIRFIAPLALILLACVACDPPPEQNPELFSGTGAVPLAEAIAEDDVESVRDQLRDGADPNAQGRYGITPLQFAIFCRSDSSLEALLEGGADPSVPGDGADTAVNTAAKSSDPIFLRLILENGGDPDARNSETGTTPLTDVILFPDDTDEKFGMLLDAGADVNAKDKLDEIPLHTAARVNAGEKVLTMLKAGADPRAENSSGATFQEYYFGYEEAVLNDRAKRERKEIKVWLREHDIPIRGNPGSERPETTEITG